MKVVIAMLIIILLPIGCIFNNGTDNENKIFGFWGSYSASNTRSILIFRTDYTYNSSNVYSLSYGTYTVSGDIITLTEKYKDGVNIYTLKYLMNNDYLTLYVVKNNSDSVCIGDFIRVK